VHRDLKPANVLIARDGTVKLVDFGVARFDVADGTLTHTDAVLGTFNYMAPEQRLRSRDVDHRADLFALGVIFYRALTGTLPIGAYERPSAMNRQVPRDYDAVVGKLLASDPQKRFADAPALARALEAIPKRRRLRSVGLALAAVAALAASGGALWAVRPDDQATSVKEVTQVSTKEDAAVIPIQSPRDEPQNMTPEPPVYEPKLEVKESTNMKQVKESPNLRQLEGKKSKMEPVFEEKQMSQNAAPAPPKRTQARPSKK